MEFLIYFAADPQCAPGTFFGIPAWYKYLYDAGYVAFNTVTNSCEFNVDLVKSGGGLDLTSLALIGLGILDILLRIAGLVAVGFVIYGGVQYMTAAGQPDKASKAFNTILNSLIGMGIVISAAAIVAFIGNRIG